MEVHRSGYYRFLRDLPLKKKDKDEAIKMKLKELHRQSSGSYGTRRLSAGLKKNNFNVGRHKTRRLMREINIVCKQRKRFRVTTDSNHRLSIADNKLNRNFEVLEKNKVWVADITYLWTQEGWLYIAAVLDLYSRRIVGWALADHMKEALINDALLMALGRRMPKNPLMHHSDRGSQYASESYRRTLEQHGIEMSMSRRGNCWDNAVMERFFGSLKSERTDWKVYQTRKEARNDVIDYIEMFYNSHRLHSTLGYMSPLEFERKKLSLLGASTFA
jgi:putative transposase